MSAYLDEVVDLISQAIISGKTMEAAVSQLKRMMSLPDDVLNSARFAYEQQIGVIRAIPDPAALMSEGTRRKTWYVGPKSGDVFWPGVARRLARSLDSGAIQSVDDASSKVLSVMAAPGEIEISTRGLVLGYVQSGKTTSFISVIAKAADAGYRFFVVLSGTTDNLRNQTQDRVDRLLIGDAGNGWIKLTNLDSDFAEATDNAANLLRAKDLRFVAVVKKNPARLRRLRDWLQAAGPAVMAGVPILLIDDEADQASVDVGTARTSAINRLLREILKQPKAAYVAYTATPFANLLIDPAGAHVDIESMSKDLYPSDFIVPLPTPAAYFGAERMFGRTESLTGDDPTDDGMDVIRHIPATEATAIRPPKGKGSVYTWDPVVGSALRESLRWFLLSTAARRRRGIGNPHSTMLVHTSMLAEAHVRLSQAILEELDRIRDALGDPSSGEREQFESLYLGEVGRVTAASFGYADIDFAQLVHDLAETVVETRVIVDNYLSIDRLTYDDEHPATTIVVGGNTLSRGLTLEGLSSSYFVRSASAYDTLLQMGRWFGYRRGYEDLCRVWMTDELSTWFRDLSLVEAEIRNEMQRYELENLNPSEVAVRIRTHPDMAITAAAKMRHADKSQLSYSTLRPQTTLFAKDDLDWLRHNEFAVRDLLSAEVSAGRVARTFPSGQRGLVGIDSSSILDFISQYSFHSDSLTVKARYLDRYVRNENAAGALLKWNVVVIEPSSPSERQIDLGLGSPVSLLQRSRLANSSEGVANLKAIVSTVDRGADLDLDRSEVLRRARGARGTVTDAELMALRSNELPGQGLLCVYPIDRDSQPQTANQKQTRCEMEAVSDVIGVAFLFPKALGAHSQVEYLQADFSGLRIEDESEELDQMSAADALDAAVLSEATS